MQVNSIDNNNYLIHNAKTSVAVGAISAGVQGLLLPSEVKSAIKNTIIGEDAFLKNTEKEAVKAGKKFGQEIDIKKTLESAKSAYPEIKQYARKAVKGMAGTLAGVSIGVFAGGVLADRIFKAEKHI